ncbi:uncharacterized protein [Leptinotarsa decemlineata]|uniref:uncharacterized protein n=1 Tax=Leptinotarsa decemlineata TaxID=7539 RepID=UPI003D306CD7
MEDEKLIELVRKYEFLYNLQHPKYMDSKKKSRAWAEIAEQLKQPASSCRLKWQGLRDSYRRALNKKKRKTGQAAKNIKKWKYEEEMSFVVPFFVERKRLESAQLTSDDEQPDEGDEASQMKDDVTTAVHMSQIKEEIISTNADAVNDTGSDLSIMNSEVRDQDMRGQTTASAVLIKLLESQNNLAPRDHDELDHFFLSISGTVKKFSPYLQAVAKNKIFGLVSEMELQQLAPPTTCTSSRHEFTST